MKIQSIELKNHTIVEVDGEFVGAYSDAKKYPVYLTNRAIKHGYEIGILDTSLYSDLVKIHQAAEGAKSVDEQSSKVLDELDQQKMINVIYLAFKGANKNLEMSQDEFLDMYHLTSQETIMTYLGLIGELLMGSDNAFVKALERDTKKSSGKKKATSGLKK